MEELQGRHRSFDLGHGVQEGGGSGCAVHWLRLMKAGNQKVSRLMYPSEMADCLIQECGFIAQIGAEGDAGAHVGVSAKAEDILHIVQAGSILFDIPRPEGRP